MYVRASTKSTPFEMTYLYYHGLSFFLSAPPFNRLGNKKPMCYFINLKQFKRSLRGLPSKVHQLSFKTDLISAVYDREIPSFETPYGNLNERKRRLDRSG